MSDIAAILIGVVLVVLLAWLAAAESALTGIGRARAEALDEDDVAGAEGLVESLADRARLVAPVLVLSLSAQLTLAAIVAVVTERRWGGEWIPLAIAITVVVVFVLAEAAPKIWGLRNIDRVAPAAATASRAIMRIPPIRLVVLALTNAARLLLGRWSTHASPVASEEEIVALADAAVAADVIDDTEGEIIQSVFDFGDMVVREAMVPRPDVLAMSSETTVDAAIEALVDRGVSRMPIYGDDIDDVRGIVHIKDLFARVQRGRGSHFVSIAQRTPYFVPETKGAASLLAELKSLPHSMVVVVDEYGGMAGIVTMEDLIEEIIGEIVDEFDWVEEPMLEPLRQGEWRVHGRIPIDEFNDLIGADLPDDDWDTLGGLIFDGLGHVPEPGESVVEGGFRLIVEEVSGQRITRVRVVDPEESDQLGDPDRAEEISS
ncbi:MAG: hemolysin family protein [Acidimicrobiales bacterium]